VTIKSQIMIQKHIKISQALSDKVTTYVTEPFGLGFSEYIRSLIIKDIDKRQALRATWDESVADAINSKIIGYDNVTDAINALDEIK